MPNLPPSAGADDRANAALAGAAGLFDDPAAISGQGGRHACILAATAACAPDILAAFLDRDHVMERIEAACDTSGRTPNDGEVESAMAGALHHATPYKPPTVDDGSELDLDPPEQAPTQLREITEDEAATAFASRYAGVFAYDNTDECWYKFAGASGWTLDKRKSIIPTMRSFLREARDTYGVQQSEKAASAGFISGVERLCRTDFRLGIDSDAWDTDHWALGIPGGTVDLRTGELSPIKPTVYMKRRTAVAPVAGVPKLWLRFLHEACRGDQSLVDWLQRLAGYCLTGDMSEEMLAFLYGPGGNGKSVYMGALLAIMGNYACNAPSDLFRADSKNNKEYQLAQLPGIRLVVASETESGNILAESLVKELTGAEGKINARNPAGRPFLYVPQAKLIIVGNHAPRLANGRTKSMERRMRVVPFTATPAHPDPNLKDKLEAEYPQILSWAIAGCVVWQADRLGSVPAIDAATGGYFGEQDQLGQWIAERCIHDSTAKGGAADLLYDFNIWLQSAGERLINKRSFKEMMLAARFESARTKHGNVYLGLQLNEPVTAEMLL